MQRKQEERLLLEKGSRSISLSKLDTKGSKTRSQTSSWSAEWPRNLLNYAYQSSLSKGTSAQRLAASDSKPSSPRTKATASSRPSATHGGKVLAGKSTPSNAHGDQAHESVPDKGLKRKRSSGTAQLDEQSEEKSLEPEGKKSSIEGDSIQSDVRGRLGTYSIVHIPSNLMFHLTLHSSLGKA